MRARVDTQFCTRLATRRMNPERAGEFEQDLFDQDKLKDMTAADGTLPGGIPP